MKEYIGKTLRDLPKKFPEFKKLRVEIPDEVKWLTDEKFKEGYIHSFHNNGVGLFVTDDPDPKDRRIKLEPVYPPSRESMLDWKIVGFIGEENE